MRIEGSSVLVTGGIGHAIAKHLRGLGADLIVTGRNTDELSRLVDATGPARSCATCRTPSRSATSPRSAPTWTS